MKRSKRLPLQDCLLDADALARLDPFELERMAKHCWAIQDDEQVIQAALDYAGRKEPDHAGARRLFNAFVRKGGRLRLTKGNALTNRLHRAIWAMSQHLFDISVHDPELRCVGKCDAPAVWHCPDRRDGPASSCARSLVFPYRHQSRRCDYNKAAKAIVIGLANAQIHRFTTDAVRKAIKRLPDKH